MGQKQHTIQRAISVSGKGLHTGQACTMTFRPAEPGTGRMFKRMDLAGTPNIPADADLVIETSRGTTLAKNDVTVQTIEHTLAALVAMGIDNVWIELDGPEPPIMDGSAKAFVEALEEAGLAEQVAEQEVFVIEEPIYYREEARGVELIALPSEEFRISLWIDFDSQAIPSRHLNLNRLSDFKADYTDARTFCFLHEVEGMAEAGLIQGANLDSALVFVEQDLDAEQEKRLRKLFNLSEITVEKGVLGGRTLRYEDEPARHKLLDLVGDLALAGMPIQGHIIATRPGHKANVEMAKKIKAQIRQQHIRRRFMQGDKAGVVFDINAIERILPHRYPFLLIDKVTSFSENRITGIKNVTVNEPFFQGHFPNNPIMPGVLQLEAMAQVGGILLLNTVEDPSSVWVYFVAIDNARFKKPVIPGDTLVFELEMTALRRRICKMTGAAYVDGELVCTADLVASLIPKEPS